MNDEHPAPGQDAPDEADLGPPIEALRDLTWAVDARFADRVRGRIERRVLAGELIALAWTAPLMILLELLRAPLEVLGGRRRP